ncbi:MAG TPA: hypothetical protein VMU81_21025 [Acetobacteraceae bacterium]|nr:hypothetical protein [Acetobacteraceae bacterium]
MRKLLLATAAAGGVMTLAAFTASAAPVAGVVDQHAAAPAHVVQADWYWHHHHWHHRRWYHGRWHYWN